MLQGFSSFFPHTASQYHFSNQIKPLNLGKSDCSCNVGKPVICKSSDESVCKIINDCQVVNTVRESVVGNQKLCLLTIF